jgi:hypothetical protein
LWGTAAASAAGAFETRFFFGGEIELRALHAGVSLGRPITPAPVVVFFRVILPFSSLTLPLCERDLAWR